MNGDKGVFVSDLAKIARHVAGMSGRKPLHGFELMEPFEKHREGQRVLDRGLALEHDGPTPKGAYEIAWDRGATRGTEGIPVMDSPQKGLGRGAHLDKLF
jgi:hypothetical protein